MVTLVMGDNAGRCCIGLGVQTEDEANDRIRGLLCVPKRDAHQAG